MARREAERPAERGARRGETNAVAAYLTALKAGQLANRPHGFPETIAITPVPTYTKPADMKVNQSRSSQRASMSSIE